MSLPVVFAKSLLSLTLLSAAAPAGGELAASVGKGDPGNSTAGAVYTIQAGGEGGSLASPEGNVHVTRTVTSYDGVNITHPALALIPDPLELAQTYAPETVEEWSRILEQYKEKEQTVGFSVHLATPAEGGTEGDGALPVKIAIRAVPAEGLDVEAEQGSGEGAPKAVAVEILETVVPEDGALTGVELSAAPSVKVLPLDEGIMKAQNAVAKALEDGQTDVIRAALHDLLTAYQAFLAEK